MIFDLFYNISIDFPKSLNFIKHQTTNNPKILWATKDLFDNYFLEQFSIF